MSLPHRRPGGINRPTTPQGEWPTTGYGYEQNDMPSPMASGHRSTDAPSTNRQGQQAQTQSDMQRIQSQRSRQPIRIDGFLNDETSTSQLDGQEGQPVMPLPPSSLDGGMPSPRSNSMPRPSNEPMPGHMGKSRSMVSEEQATPQEPASIASTNGIDDDEYRQFLEWKKAKQEKAERSQAGEARETASMVDDEPGMGIMDSPVDAMPIPVGPATAPISDGTAGSPIVDAKSAVRQRSHEHVVNAPIKTDNRSYNDKPVRPEPTIIHRYPGYNGTGYPKGLGHGPIVERTNINTGKKVKIEGIAWEDFPPAYQRMLDRQPYDDAGELRIFVRSNGKVKQQYPFYELGSDEHSKKLMDELKSKSDLIFNNGVNLSYASRPQLDSAAWLPPAK